MRRRAEKVFTEGMFPAPLQSLADISLLHKGTVLEEMQLK